MTNLTQRLRELEELDGKRTQGDWWVSLGSSLRVDQTEKGRIAQIETGPHDEDFIAAAPSAVALARELMGLLIEAGEALKPLFESTRPSYHDCLDNGEPECHFCIAENAITKLKSAGIIEGI